MAVGPSSAAVLRLRLQLRLLLRGGGDCGGHRGLLQRRDHPDLDVVGRFRRHAQDASGRAPLGGARSSVALRVRPTKEHVVCLDIFERERHVDPGPSSRPSSVG